MIAACACTTARQLARVLTQFYDCRLRESGLEAPQFAILMTFEQGGLYSQVDLSRRYALDKTTVSRNLKVLERYGWIEPSASKDKRKRQFALTAAGQKRLAIAKPKWEKAQRQVRAAVTPEQWDQMFQVFKAVTEAVQRMEIGQG